MFEANRRIVLQSIAIGAGTFAASQSLAAGPDGHAAGYEVSAASEYLKTIPRKSGDPVVFTASLDKGPIKATSGGWAREVTTRGLPIATDIAGAHLFMNAGGAREMHWHNSAEWAYVVDGHCQVTVVDPEGVAEVVNLGPGDLWYFPKGHGHAIQTLGPTPCHAILAFDDGLYSEHGTFGISDWMSRYDTRALSQAFAVCGRGFRTNSQGRDLHHAGRGAGARWSAGAFGARIGSLAHPSPRHDGSEAESEHAGRRTLCGVFQGISDVDDVDGNGSKTEARCDARTALAHRCQ